jgi:transglutaminase-like putative cysteine protease
LGALLAVLTIGLGSPLCLASGFLEEAEVRARADAVDAKDWPGQSHVKIYHFGHILVRDTGMAIQREQIVWKVLTPAGVKALSVLRFDYDPDSSEVELEHVVVLRGDGSRTEVSLQQETAFPPSAAQGGLHDLPQTNHGIFWPLRMLLVRIPALQPGDTVVVHRTFRGFQVAYLREQTADPDQRFVPPQVGEFYEVAVFGEPVPVIHRELQVQIPPGKPPNVGIYNGTLDHHIEETPEATTHRFVGRSIPAFPPGVKSMSLSDVAPKVVMSTLPSWPQRSQWFYLVSEPSFQLTEDLISLAKSIVQGISRDEDRVKALNRWVAHHIRYSGLSVGPGEGYTIHPASLTARERMGVCKDMAGLQVALMRALGYRAFAAMTMAGARVEEVPADQFNHAVVVWQRDDGSHVLVDPTWAVLSSKLWSHAEAGQHYVAGLPQGDRLRMTPHQTPADNAVTVRMDSELESSGSLSAEVHIVATGFLDTSLRRIFGYSFEGTWGAILQDLAWHLWPSAVVTSTGLSRKAVEDLDRPFELRFSVSGSLGVDRLPQRFPWRPASFRMFLWAAGRLAENRVDLVPGQAGAYFWSTKTLRYVETTRLPRGYRIRPFPGFSFANQWGSVTGQASMKARDLRVDVQVEFAAREVPASEIPAYQELLSAVAALSKLHLVLEGGRP